MALTDTKEVSGVTIAQKLGASHKVGTPSSVTVLEVDQAFNVVKAKGATLPSDGDSGFAKGCQFIKTGGALGTTVYINEGSESAADFNGANTTATTQGAPTAKTTSTLLTAAELLTRIITVAQGAGASSALQLPTGTNIQNALPSGFAVGDTIEFSVINTSTVDAEDATITVNTDVTIVGSADIVAHSDANKPSSALFRLRKTADHVFICYRIA